MDFRAYFMQLNDLYMKLLGYIENEEEDNSDDGNEKHKYFMELINYADESKICEDLYEFKSFLHLISSVSNNHHRTFNWYAKSSKLSNLNELIKSNLEN